jgi:hypothetical protein
MSRDRALYRHCLKTTRLIGAAKLAVRFSAATKTTRTTAGKPA